MPLLVLALPLVTATATCASPVVKVVDGDTIHVLHQAGTLKVRFSGIDTPEGAQPCYQRARQALAGKVVGKIVIIEEVDRDRYGRLVGRVWLDSRDINREMVAEGQAWVYRRYMRDPTLYDDEERSREAKLGL